MTFTAGDLGYDTPRATTNYDALQQMGSKFVVRYSAGAASLPSDPSHGANLWKLCQHGEIARVLAQGQDFGANDEWTTARVTEGAAAGRADGLAALDFWQSMGLAKGAGISLNLDSAPNVGAELRELLVYADAYRNALDGYYVPDRWYAGLPMCVALNHAGHCRVAWLPGAASWSVPNVGIPSNLAPPAHTAWELWQPTSSQMAPARAWLRARALDAGWPDTNPIIWQTGNQALNRSCDENVVVIGGRMGFHKETLDGPTPPPPGRHLRRAWPHYMAEGDYFGPLHGPEHSRGGYHAFERADVLAIKERLIALGYRGMTRNGYFGRGAEIAVTAWQAAHHHTDFPGRVYRPSWDALFTY